MENTPSIPPEAFKGFNQRINEFLKRFREKMTARFGNKSVLPLDQVISADLNEAGEALEKKEFGQQERLVLFARINKLVQDGKLEDVSEVHISATREGAVDALAIAELMNTQEAVWMHDLDVGDVAYWIGPQQQKYYYLIEEKYDDRRINPFSKKGKGTLQTNETDRNGSPLERVFNAAIIYGSNFGSLQASSRIIKNGCIELAVFNPEKTELSKQEYKRRKSSGERLVPESQVQHSRYDVFMTPPVESFGVIRKEKINK